jgi:hypothetical protein
MKNLNNTVALTFKWPNIYIAEPQKIKKNTTPVTVQYCTTFPPSHRSILIQFYGRRFAEPAGRRTFHKYNFFNMETNLNVI